MRALAIISAEHRNMWRMATALSVLAKRFRSEAAPAELHTVDLILDYFESFASRFHHPKEEEFLFARVLERSTAPVPVIARLESQHEKEPRQVGRMRELLRRGGFDRDETRYLLVDELESFHDRLMEHMRVEEEEVFPLARKLLTAEDWARIDTAFAEHDDPYDHATDREEIALLRSRVMQLLPEPEGLGARLDASPAHAPPVRPPVEAKPVALAVEKVRSAYGGIEVLHGVDLEVRAGSLVALVGANGAGKTTLLRCISGVQPLAGGAIRFSGEDISALRPDRRVRAGICQVPEGRQVFGPMSVADNLRLGAYIRPQEEVAESLEEIYGIFPILKERRAQPAGMLSGGQQQMLALGRAMMGKPRLLLLDEPSMGLAPLIVEEIFRIVRMLKDRGMTILLVEQNARAALNVADFAYVLETGRVTLSGPGRELIENDEVRRAYLGM